VRLFDILSDPVCLVMTTWHAARSADNSRTIYFFRLAFPAGKTRPCLRIPGPA
jgi:hypothetical protein